MFSAGQMVTLLNNSGSSTNITQGGGFSLFWTNDGNTGNRVMGARAVCTILFQGSGHGYISGSGLT